MKPALRVALISSGIAVLLIVIFFAACIIRRNATLDRRPANVRLVEALQGDKRLDDQLGTPLAYLQEGGSKSALQERERQRIVHLLKLDSKLMTPKDSTSVTSSCRESLPRECTYKGKKFLFKQDLIDFKVGSSPALTAYLLRPAPSSRSSSENSEALAKRDKEPCIICIPGHGQNGVGDIIGLNSDGSYRDAIDGPYDDYALQCVANGYTVLAFDQAGMGTRRDSLTRNFKSMHILSCEIQCGKDVLFGRSMLAERIEDVSQAVTYLRSLPKIDTGKIGIMGASAGGTTALISAALDSRIAAAVIIDSFGTNESSIYLRLHCFCNYVPALLSHGIESRDFASLMAPRPLFIQYSCLDQIFRPKGVRDAFPRVKAAYREFHAESNLERELALDAHMGFQGDKAFSFLSHQLSLDQPK